MSYDAYDVAGQKLMAKFKNGTTCEVELRRRISTRFATTSNGSVVKIANGEILPPDEPLFVLRARDILAIPMLLHFEELIKQQNYDHSYILELGAENQRLFNEFAKEHPERMKLHERKMTMLINWLVSMKARRLNKALPEDSSLFYCERCKGFAFRVCMLEENQGMIMQCANCGNVKMFDKRVPNWEEVN